MNQPADDQPTYYIWDGKSIHVEVGRRSTKYMADHYKDMPVLDVNKGGKHFVKFNYLGFKFLIQRHIPKELKAIHLLLP